jgi:hypothetical protein
MNLGVAGSEVQTDSPKNRSEFDFIIFNKISTQVVKKKKNQKFNKIRNNLIYAEKKPFTYLIFMRGMYLMPIDTFRVRMILHLCLE